MTPTPSYSLDTTEDNIDTIMEAMKNQGTTDEDDKHIDLKTPPLCGSYRLFVVICGSMVMMVSFASQASMTSSMVCMINDNTTAITNLTVSSNHANIISTGYDESVDEHWKFSWDSETQGWVVSSFFFGYYFMQLPSGVLVTRLGPKSSMVLCLFTTAILHLLTIPAAIWSLPVLYIVRTLTGLTSGCLFSATFALTANWCPRQETSMMFSIACVGLEIGNSFIFLISLFACEMDFQGGWPIIFYTLASAQILLGVVTGLGVTDYPNTNRFIRDSEARYIEQNRSSENKVHSIPFGKILRSAPVWAFVMAQLAIEYFYYTIITQGPLFMRDILKLPHWQSNLISSIPFMVVTPLAFCFGYISDTLIAKKIFSTTSVRKINDSISKILTAVPLVILLLLPEGSWIPVLFTYVVAAVGIQFCYTGFMANPGDLSPAHAGFLAGWGQALTTWVAFVIPVLTGWLTKEKTRQGWYVIFYIAVGLEVFCLLFFLLFGSGNLQPWAVPEVEEIPILSDKKSKNGVTTLPHYQALNPQNGTQP